jgi:hypothetical protein
MARKKPAASRSRKETGVRYLGPLGEVPSQEEVDGEQDGIVPILHPGEAAAAPADPFVADPARLRNPFLRHRSLGGLNHFAILAKKNPDLGVLS